ncbi:MAG TPA: SRPBCC family protein [Mycobacteriales bacterium]
MSTIDIARPPEEVFAYATDPTRFAEWQNDVIRVQVEDGQSPGVGCRFTTTRRVGGSERTMTQQITAIDAPRSWTARGIDGPIRPHATITVEPLDGGARSHVTFALAFDGHGLGVPLLPLVRRQSQRHAPTSYRNLKKRLETRQ